MRAITGVQTSVTAFIGTSGGGALNQPVHLLTFADFELNCGGLTPERELGYSVRQFFLNGDIEAWVVRVPDNPTEEHWRDGIRALDSVDLFNLLILPGVTSAPPVMDVTESAWHQLPASVPALRHRSVGRKDTGGR